MIAELIILLLILLCSIRRKNCLIYALFIALMIVLMAFTTFNADFYAYMGRYERAFSFNYVLSTDKGFGILMYLCKTMGLSFSTFLGVVSIIGLFLFSIAAWKFSDMPCLMLAIFFTLFYYTYTVQLRSFIAEMITVIAVFNFLKYKSNWCLFVLLVLIASLFHYTMIFYLVMLLPKLLKDKKKVYLITALLIIIMPLIVRLMLRFSGANAQIRMDVYFSKSNTNINASTIAFILLFVGITIITGILSRKCFNNGEEIIGNQLLMITDFNIISWISLGLIVVYSNNFFRINRPMIIVSLVSLMQYIFRAQTASNVVRQRYIIGIVGMPLIYISVEVLTRTWITAISYNSLLQILL